MGNLMEKENILGKLVKFMLESSSKVKNKAKVNGKVIETMSNLINMKVNIIMIKNMERVFTLGQVEILIRVILLKMKDKEMVQCYGLMEVCMKESGQKEFSMDLEGWCFLMALLKKVILKIIFIKEK